MRTVSVETMRKSDAYTIANKVPSKELMRRAGEGIFKSAKWVEPVAIVCGKGNNAGDGYVVASLMKDADMECELFLVSDDFSEDGKYYYDICVEKGIEVHRCDSSSDFSGYGSILDCIFGTGFNGGRPRDLYERVINAINMSGAYVVAADINSGLNGDTGEGIVYVKSDLTVSIGEFKTGHFTGLCDEAMKNKVNVDIGIEIIEDDMNKEYKFWGHENTNVKAITNEYKGIETPLDLYDALSNIWCAETCAPRMRNEWSKENMTLGQCSITAFLAQDIFGGEVYGILRPGGNYHCYNVVGNCKFDLTSEQFGETVLDYSDNPQQFREIHFAKEEKRLRYEYLKSKLKTL